MLARPARPARWFAAFLLFAALTACESESTGTCGDADCVPGTWSCLEGGEARYCAFDEEGCAVAEEAVSCDDGSACTEDLCDEGAGCLHPPLDFDDGDLCNGVESCDPALGEVKGEPLDCDDGLKCTGSEACDPEVGCAIGTAPGGCCTSDDDCDDENPCNGSGVCAVVSGTCLLAPALSCTDGNVCNGIETCNQQEGDCQPGEELECDDGSLCNGLEVCEPATGCQPGLTLVCDDGLPCNGTETCDPEGGCVIGESLPGCCKGLADCEDGNTCNGEGDCDLETETCQVEPPTACEDGDPCNGIHACSASAGCLLVLDPPICEDGNPCNGQTVCQPGVGCSPGPPLACEDGDICNGLKACDPALAAGGGDGCFQLAPELQCDDGNPCTATTCNPATGCVSGFAVGCDDKDPCNGVETCIDQETSVQCVDGQALECDDELPCNGAELCDPDSGDCKNGAALSCDDGLACNGIESCMDGAGGCVPGASLECDDGQPCNGLEACDDEAGGCEAGKAVECDDSDACNGLEACDVGSGACLPGELVGCDDGEPCDGLETCDPATGDCLGGDPLDCDDADPSTADSCETGVGCVHQLICVPACDGKLCGDDGCGGTCGSCGPGESCTLEGQCLPECAPNCEGKACGADGCGGVCGSCGAGVTCTAEGLCQPSCVPEDEVCDGADNDCDDLVDEDLDLGACGACDDGLLECVDGDPVCSGASEPTAEVCDGLDNDCDGTADNNLSSGVGEPCDGSDDDLCPSGLTICAGDAGILCDEAPGPGIVEVCDGADNDCDGTADTGEDLAGCTEFYLDGDGDSFGIGGPKCLCAAEGPGGFTATQAGDCEDSNPGANPLGSEVCGDGLDNDCVDGPDSGENAAGCTIYYKDGDGDGDGLSGDLQCLCAPAAPYSALSDTDCDDLNPKQFLGNAEICDGVDNDCDLFIDGDDSGLETDTDTDPEHCGGCFSACSAPNVQTSACSLGSCEVAVCEPGTFDEDGSYASGCDGALTTFTVDTNLGDDGIAEGNGGSTPFQTIQKAIDLSGPSQIVQIESGTYPEILVIDSGRDGLRLVGLGADAFGVSIGVSTVDAVVFVEADHVEIENLTIAHPGGGPEDGTALFALGAEGLRLTSVRLQTQSVVGVAYGIRLFDSPNGIFDDVDIPVLDGGSTVGWLIEQSPGSEITNSTVSFLSPDPGGTKLAFSMDEASRDTHIDLSNSAGGGPVLYAHGRNDVDWSTISFQVDKDIDVTNWGQVVVSQCSGPVVEGIGVSGVRGRYPCGGGAGPTCAVPGIRIEDSTGVTVRNVTVFDITVESGPSARPAVGLLAANSQFDIFEDVEVFAIHGADIAPETPGDHDGSSAVGVYLQGGSVPEIADLTIWEIGSGTSVGLGAIPAAVGLDLEEVEVPLLHHLLIYNIGAGDDAQSPGAQAIRLAPSGGTQIQHLTTNNIGAGGPLESTALYLADGTGSAFLVNSILQATIGPCVASSADHDASDIEWSHVMTFNCLSEGVEATASGELIVDTDPLLDGSFGLFTGSPAEDAGTVTPLCEAGGYANPDLGHTGCKPGDE